jgi:hypothetical protein
MAKHGTPTTTEQQLCTVSDQGLRIYVSVALAGILVALYFALTDFVF